MSILASEKTKEIQWKNVTLSGNRTRASHNLWFQFQHYPFWTKLTFACKTETLDPLYSHALLIIAKFSQFLQVQKLSGTWTEI